jgi:hypothetical protein
VKTVRGRDLTAAMPKSNFNNSETRPGDLAKAFKDVVDARELLK